MMIEQLGMEGYGIYWVLVETLRDQPDYKYPLILLPALARRYNTTAEKMRTVVCNYGLFKTEEDKFFFSESLIYRMEKLSEKRDKLRVNALKRWHGEDAKAMQLQCKSNAIAMPVKQSIVKQSKVKQSIVKHKYGEYQNVLLADEQLEKIKIKFIDWEKRIENLSQGIELKGYVYKNHYLAILKWAEKDEKDKPQSKPASFGYEGMDRL